MGIDQKLIFSSGNSSRKVTTSFGTVRINHFIAQKRCGPDRRAFCTTNLRQDYYPWTIMSVFFCPWHWHVSPKIFWKAMMTSKGPVKRRCFQLFLTIWLVIWNMFYCSIFFLYILGITCPNWRTHIFQRGGSTTSPTSHSCRGYIPIHRAHCLQLGRKHGPPGRL